MVLLKKELLKLCMLSLKSAESFLESKCLPKSLQVRLLVGMGGSAGLGRQLPLGAAFGIIMQNYRLSYKDGTFGWLVVSLPNCCCFQRPDCWSFVYY